MRGHGFEELGVLGNCDIETLNEAAFTNPLRKLRRVMERDEGEEKGREGTTGRDEELWRGVGCTQQM